MITVEDTLSSEPSPHSLPHLFLGHPLRTEEAHHQTIGKTVGLAVFASDALSSVAYATQEILYVLALAGAGVLSLSLPIAGTICLLIIIVTLSYRQTIFAYPNGGGAYIVARDNLGEHVAQLAGAALLTDYVLTVAVSISSGVEQIASAFPTLFPYRIEVCLALIALMTVVNLRGIKEAGNVFAGPTYFFIGMTFLLIGLGMWRWMTGTLSHVKEIELEVALTQPLTLFLILRAFSSGSTALTGIEAISNGITAFKEPRSRNAAATMAWMSGILMTMFIGITLLAHHTHALPTETETIISQLARTIFGLGPLYYLMIAATTIILIMAANTSYADFPRLAALQAGDGFLPRQLALRGHRLVFSWGIVTLAVCASLLIVVFNARTTALIPLYAIGVFLSFTISQAGMVIRWLKISRLRPGEKHQTRQSQLHYDRHWQIKLALNALGCVTTGIVTLVFAITKFNQGAWIVVLVMAGLVWLFFRIHHHYQVVARSLSLERYTPKATPACATVVLLVSSVHRGTLHAARYARTIQASNLIAVHVAVDPEQVGKVQERWERWEPEIPLVVIESPYRTIIRPLVWYVRTLSGPHGTDLVTIVLPQFVCVRWWHDLLHNHMALLIRQAFLFDRNKVVVEVPFLLEE